MQPTSTRGLGISEDIMMKRRRPKLYLVSHDPADVFNDLEGLRADLKSPPQRRPKATELFARIPCDKALALYRHRIGSAAWMVLIEIDRMVIKRRGRNPIRFESSRLRSVGIVGRVRMRALRQLEAAGAIQVAWRRSGLCPWVLHLWYPVNRGDQ
jgi:hypothetical protein